MTFRIAMLDADPNAPFPDPANALRDPDGLLAVGGDLSSTRLLNAYRAGIFPWFSQGQPILWWSPDPRMVFASDGVRLSRRDHRHLCAQSWVVRSDTAFDAVVAACASIARRGESGTWITASMSAAYAELHRLGHAHSIEVWDGDLLVGGLYGVAIGQMFFGESMFSAISGGSKAALAALGWILCQWDWPLFDAQVESPHLAHMGAVPMSRPLFLAHLEAQCCKPGRISSWSGIVGTHDLRTILQSLKSG